MLERLASLEYQPMWCDTAWRAGRDPWELQTSSCVLRADGRRAKPLGVQGWALGLGSGLEDRTEGPAAAGKPVREDLGRGGQSTLG